MMKKEKNELFEEELNNIINNKSFAFNKTALIKIKKEVSSYKSNETVHQSYNHVNPMKGVIYMMLGAIMTGIPTILKGGKVDSKQIGESINDEVVVEASSNTIMFADKIGQVTELMTVVTGLAGIIFMFLGVLTLKRYADGGGGASSTSKSSINENKLDLFEKNKKKESIILSLLNISKYEELDSSKNKRNIIKNLDTLSEKRIEDVRKSCLIDIQELIEIYKSEKNKVKLINLVKITIAKDQEKYSFLKDNLFNPLIDLDKEVDFNKIDISIKKKNFEIKSI
jgi:hypothetical protein